MRGVRRMLAGVVVVVAAVVVFVVLSSGGDGDGARDRSDPPPRDALRLGSRTIAFVCARRICVWEAAKRAPRPLTERSGLGDASPVWSPDGSRIAFVHRRAAAGAGSGSGSGRAADGRAGDGRAADGRADLYVMRADGSSRTRVATGLALSPLVLYGPPFAWSPNGSQLAVSLRVPAPRRPPGPRTKRELFDAAITGPASDLHLVDLATRRTRRLTRSAGFDGLPVWSGARVVYARLRRDDPQFRSDVRVIDAVTGGDRLLRHAASTVNLLVASPDARRVAVAIGRANGPGVTALDIDGAGTQTLVQRCCASGVAWAPDERRLAVSGLDGPRMFMAEPGSERLRPTASGLPCLSPDWSRDGESVICHRPYEGARAGESDLVLVDPATGAVKRLTDTGTASDARWRPAGREI